jgi:hypothetical protein
MSTIKCPKCKGELSTTDSICEWCGLVINKSGDDSLDIILNKLRELIVTGKKIPQQGLFSSFSNNAKISMPIFAIVSFILAYKINALFAIVGIAFTLYAFFSIFKKRTNISFDIQKLKAEFDIEIKRMQNLYGGNNTIAKQIQECKNEWKEINAGAKNSKRLEWVSYIIITTLLIVVVALPTPKTTAEENLELAQSEDSIVLKANKALENGTIEDAQQLLNDIKSIQNITRVKSAIQLKKNSDEIAKAESKINAGEFQQAKNILEKLKWVKNSVEYDAEQIEEIYFKQFVQQKNNLIKKMPDSFQIELEDEYGF